MITTRTPSWRFSVMLLVTFVLTLQSLSGFAQVAANSTAARTPITLSLKEELSSPINPGEVFPEIKYQVAPDVDVSIVTWVFSIEKGIPKGMLGASLYPVIERSEEVKIVLSDKAGTLTGKDGDMRKFLSMWITYGKIQGEGTMGIALMDFREWQEKGEKAQRISNVLELPVRLPK